MRNILIKAKSSTVSLLDQGQVNNCEKQTLKRFIGLLDKILLNKIIDIDGDTSKDIYVNKLLDDIAGTLKMYKNRNTIEIIDIISIIQFVNRYNNYTGALDE